MQQYAWIFNLDADLELASRDNDRYAPTNAVKTAMARSIEHLTALFVGANDILIDESSPAGVANGFVGRAWCPTKRAIAIMNRAGATIPRHPPQEVLRRVNGREFCASLGGGGGQTLPGATFVKHIDEARTILATRPPVFHDWRVKRAFGMAGRGQRKIDPTRGGLTAADLAAIAAAIRDEGGVQIEPNVTTIERELAQHAMLAEDGSYEIGALVVQECDPHGQWLATKRLIANANSNANANANDDDATIKAAMESEVTTVARALHSAGYFGPFGIDAFVYRDPLIAAAEDNPVVCHLLQPRSEINARYSMGFASGFASSATARATIDGR